MDKLALSQVATSSRFQRQRDYWEGQLSGRGFVLAGFPSDREAEGSEPARGFEEATIPEELGQRLEALGRGSDYALFTFLTALLRILLARCSGQQQPVIGLCAFSKGWSSDLLAAQLPLAGELRPDRSIRQIVRQTQELVQGIRRHQDYPLEAMLTSIAPLMVQATFPVLTWMDSIQHPQFAESRVAETSFRYIRSGSQLRLRLEYDRNRHRAHSAQRLCSRLLHLLGQSFLNPSCPIADVEILPPSERRQILEDFIGAPRAESAADTFLDLFAAQVGAHPQRIALQQESDSLTYIQLDRWSDRICRWLQSHGAKRGSRIGICMERSLQGLASLLAIFKSGASCLGLDPSHPKGRIRFMTEEAGLDLLLVDEQTRTRFGGETLPQELHPDRELGRRQPKGTLLSAFPEEALPCPQDEAYAIFTSGSSGRPKGAGIHHRGYCNVIEGLINLLDIGPGDRQLQAASWSFDAWLLEVGVALGSGATLCLLPRGVRGAGEELHDALGRCRISHAMLTPTAVSSLPARTLPDLQVLAFGAESLPPRLVRAWKQGRRIFNLYGPTEASIAATGGECRDGDTAPSIGRPLPGCGVRLLDPRLRPVPLSVAGRMHLTGIGIGLGYLGRPATTAERFLPDPFSEVAGQRMYDSGDSARWRRDGRLDFLGRLDRQIKLRGVRMEPGEIEAALEQHQQVRQSCVLLREDRPGEERLTAYIVAEPGAPDEEEGWLSEVRAHLEENLPESMIPSALVPLPAFPLTAGGKLDREALPPPPSRAGKPAPDYVAPRNPVERTLADICAQVLAVEEVGVRDNLFELGCDSINAIQIAARAHQAGLKISVQQLFREPRVESLARAARPAPTMSSPQEEATGEIPLTPIQEWFFQQEIDDRRRFSQVLLVEPPTLDVARLGSGLRILLAHHDALRQRFRESEAGWTADIATAAPVDPLTEIDLRSLPSAAAAAAWTPALDSLSGSFDLSTGPLMRSALIRSRRGHASTGAQGGDEESCLALAVHHLAVDGISWRILAEDLMTACRSAGGEAEPNLGPKTSPLRLWARRLRDWADEKETRSQESYWAEMLKAKLPRIPIDSPAPDSANRFESADAVSLQLDQSTTRSLLQEVGDSYRIRINDVLLTALARCFSRWSGSDQLFLNLESHGREPLFDDLDISRTVGWFTAQYPVLLAAHHSQTLRQSLLSVKESLRSVPQGGLGFGALRYSCSRRAVRQRLASLSHPQVAFNYLGQAGSAIESGMAVPEEGADSDPSPGAVGLRGRRSHLIEVNGLVSGGRLQMDWSYCRLIHRRATIEALAQGFSDELKELVAHCSSPGSWGYSASDSPESDLDQAGLDRLLESLAEASPGLAGKGRIESVLPLLPGQIEMLASVESAPDTPAYRLQSSWRLQGRLDVEALKSAWDTVVDRHSALRLYFHRVPGRPQPWRQIVARRVNPEWSQSDWSALSPLQRDERLEAFRRDDLLRGFDLKRPPLVRFALQRFAAEEWQLTVSIHHLLMDGWSFPIVMREAVELYRSISAAGSPLDLESPPDWRRCVGWLAQQEFSQARTFWSEYLDGCLDGIERSEGIVARGQAQSESTRWPYQHERSLVLDQDSIGRLQSLARAGRITLSTIVQAAWALVLAGRSQGSEALFAATSAARPPDLERVEEMTAMLANTLPVRIALPSSVCLVDWLQQVQRDHVSRERFGFVSLAQIRGWTGLPADGRCLESCLRFQNYPLGPLEGNQEQPDDLVLAGADMIDWWHYPLNLIVVPGEQLELTLSAEADRFDQQTLDWMLRQLARVLSAMSANRSALLGELRAIAASESSAVDSFG